MNDDREKACSHAVAGRASRRWIVRLLGVIALGSALAPLPDPGAVAAEGKKRKSAGDLENLVPAPSPDPAAPLPGPTNVDIDINVRFRIRSRVRSRTNIRF
jgi:hypothetical protein